MNKRTCKKCNKEKSLESFVANKNCKLGREWQCNTCKNKNNKSRKKGSEYYKRHRDIRNKKIWKLKELGCSLCKERSPECIDFHHIEPEFKEGQISRMSGVKMIKELLKCSRVCSNCHRKIHAGTIDKDLISVSKEEIEKCFNLVFH